MIETCKKLRSSLDEARRGVAKFINANDDDFSKDDILPFVRVHLDWHPVYDSRQWVTNVLRNWEKRGFIYHSNKHEIGPGKMSIIKLYRRKARITLRLRR